MAQDTPRSRVLSGIQPTGEGFHLGSWLGAVRNWVAMQDTHDAFYCVVDLHAITVGHDPEVLRRRTYESVAELIAMGIDPARCTLFVQSHIPEHTELAWVLSCITGFGEASRMTQFKDRSQRYGADSVSVGVFGYPILQAADILLYQAAQVPVGQDQRQHLELTRDLAQRFNHRFGDTFVVPEAHIPSVAGKVNDLQEPERVMSKSVGGPGVIWMQDQPGRIRKKVKSAVTDSGSEIKAANDKPGITNLLSILAAVTGRSVAELESAYAGQGYGALKNDVAEAVVDLVTPIQDRYRGLVADTETLDSLLAEGAARARNVASETMRTVRDRVGFVPSKG
ncbi:MAG: tryptophan--tRNA ligase [Actinomycetes bacterium]